MKHSRIVERLQEKIDAYTGIEDETQRQLDGVHQILADLVTILHFKKTLNKKDLKALFEPHYDFDKENEK